MLNADKSRVLMTLEANVDYIKRGNGFYFSPKFIKNFDISELYAADPLHWSNVDIIDFCMENDLGWKFNGMECVISDPITEEKLLTLSRNYHYTIDEAGLPVLSKSFLANVDLQALKSGDITPQPGGDMQEAFRKQGYQVELNKTALNKTAPTGYSVLLTDENGRKQVISDNQYVNITADGAFFTDKAGQDKLLKSLLNDSPLSRKRDQVLGYMRKVAAGEDLDPAEIELVAQNIELLENDFLGQRAMENLFKDKEFSEAWNARMEEAAAELEKLNAQLDRENEIWGELGDAAEKVGCILISVVLGIPLKTDDKKFNAALQILSAVSSLTVAGFARHALSKSIKKAVTAGLRKCFSKYAVVEKIIAYLQRESVSLFVYENYKNINDLIDGMSYILDADIVEKIREIFKAAYENKEGGLV